MPAGVTESLRGLVLDASVSAAWFLPQQHSQAATALLRDGNLQYHVPALWLTEMANVFLLQERRHTISSAEAGRFLDTLQRMPITVEDAMSGIRSILPLLDLSRNQQITAYDAHYLALSRRRGLPLATLDRKLAAAARALAIPLAIP